MGQYSENGCRLASDAAKKRHNNKPVEYCRKHCFESSCIGCVLSGQPKKEVEEMPRGIKECPGCHEPIPSRAYAGHIATCEKYAIYAGAQETQGLEETPKEPAVAEEPKIKKPEPAPVERSVLKKAQDTQQEELEERKKDITLCIDSNKSLCQIVSEQEKAIRVLIQMVADEDSDVILVQALAELHDLRNK